jgi:hypothetical protein
MAKQLFLWIDRWIGEISLSYKFPNLFPVASNKKNIVTKVFELGIHYLSFYSHLMGPYLLKFNALIDIINDHAHVFSGGTN